MNYIFGRWHKLLSSAIANSKFQISEAFLAALIANESGGHADEKRLEKHVFAELIKVSQGRQPNFGSITLGDIQSLNYDELMDLATSWGLTQVMGYHTLAMTRKPTDLLEPEFNVVIALSLLKSFAKRWGIDPTERSDELFRAWNTGRPNGKTYDPDYIPRAILRMGIYAKLEGRTQNAESGPIVTDPKICM